MLLTKITLSLLIIKTINCEDKYSDKFKQYDINSGSTECIKSIIRKYYPCGSLMTLVDSIKETELIRSLNSESDCYSFIIRSFDDTDWFTPTPVYVIRAKNLTEFSEGFLSVINDLFWNPRGQFIIEVETLDGDEERDSVLYSFMQHKAYNVVLIRKSNNDYAIDTHYPFRNNNCGKILDVVTIGACQDISHLELFVNKEISMKNCTVRVAAAQDIPIFIFESNEYTVDGKYLVGSEQLLLETIAEKEGFEVSYMLVEQSQRAGVVLPNNTATGLLGVLQNQDVDIAAGGFFLIRNRILLFDHIWGYNYASFEVLTPVIGEEIWKDVFREFGVESWTLIVVSYILVSVITTMRLRLHLRRKETQMCLALKIWGYLFLNTSSKLCEDKRFRMIMVFWIWFTFFICNFYTTQLYSLLTGRNRIQRHISAESLHELPFEPCISRTTRTYYQFAFQQTLPENGDIPGCEVTHSAIKNVATQKNVYAIEVDYVYKLHKYKYADEDGMDLIETWTFSISNVLAMYITRGFPIRDKLQHYAWRMFETGILKNNLEQIYQLKNHPQPENNIYFEKMNLPDMRIHFSILMVGYVLSMLCFVLEILWHRYSKTIITKWRRLL